MPPVSFAAAGIEIAALRDGNSVSPARLLQEALTAPAVSEWFSAWRSSWRSRQRWDDPAVLVDCGQRGSARRGENSHIVTALLGNCGLTVVTVPADTGYTIRLENAGAPEPAG
jgi:hypothetical protein